MKTDLDIQHDVEAELRWDPDIDATDIAVKVNRGVVALTGFVKRFLDKYEAEKAAKRVSGVVGVANDIEVRVPAVDAKPDPEIARAAVDAIRVQLPLSADHIRVVVKNGWVTLEGEVPWQYQRISAEKAVQPLTGVKGVTNAIVLKPGVRPSDIKQKIMEAFKRSAEVDASHISVDANGSEVILKGTVRSWTERQEAERTAWAAPGVTKVVDQITVSP